MANEEFLFDDILVDCLEEIWSASPEGPQKLWKPSDEFSTNVFDCFLKFQLNMLKEHEDTELSESQISAAKRMARLFTTVVSSLFATTQGMRSLDEALQANQALLVWVIKSLKNYYVVRMCNSPSS